MQRLRLALTVNLPKSTTSAFFLENRLTPNFNAHHSLFLSSSIQSRSIQRYSTSTSPPRITPRMRITFTCTAPACTDPGYRSTHEFSKQAYEKGIVLVQCPGCKTRHLIADHIGWFNSDDLTQGGKYKTIEALMASKGHMVKRGSISEDGKEGETIEMYEDEEPVSNGAPDGTAAG